MIHHDIVLTGYPGFVEKFVMTETAKLQIGDKSVELPIVTGVHGERIIRIVSSCSRRDCPIHIHDSHD